MQGDLKIEKPVLIAVGVLPNGTPAYAVQYKNRFLYSKYNPTKNIEAAIQNTEILPGTLFFVFSPCLFYGIETLIKKCGGPNGAELGKNVFIVAVEAEKELYNLTVSTKQGQKAEAEARCGGGQSADDGKNDLGIEGAAVGKNGDCIEYTSRVPEVQGFAGAAGVQLFPREYLNAEGINLFLQNLTSSAAPKIKGLSLPAPGIIRRAIRFDFSGGVAFNADFYNQFFALSQNAIAQFWKNRLTLVKLGRLYCKNIFKNLPVASGAKKGQGFENALKFENLEKTISRPILVLGAGESLEQITVSKSSKQGQKTNADAEKNALGFDPRGFYIIAVDAALAPLLAAGIVPDAVVASEAQLAIEKAYIGNQQAMQSVSKAQGVQGADSRKNAKDIEAAKKPILFCDLTSRHTIPRMECFEPCFFFSEFEKNNFTERLKQNGILPRTFPPLGSVGITATYIATLLRSGDDVPIYVSGLDFSFSLGKTHANGTMAHKARLLANSRLTPLANYGAAFALGAEKVIGKNGEQIFTTKNLFGYAALFKNFFDGTKNLFDCGTSGLQLIINNEQLTIGGVPSMPNSLAKDNGIEPTRASTRYGFANDNSIERIKNQDPTRAFLEEERAALLALADILTNGENAKSRDKAIPYNEQIFQLLSCREYLYLHFPDGATASLESSFLNRVRTQINFFLKEIDCSLAKISPQPQ